MRFLIVIVVAVSIAAAFAAEPPTWKTVTITLTNAQAEAVAAAKGKDIEINLTKEQINTITKAAYVRIGIPDTVGFKTITLNTAHLRTGNKVVVGYHPPDTTDDPIKVEPVRAE
jgi:3-isopropylmalate dehydratase small subunit